MADALPILETWVEAIEESFAFQPGVFRRIGIAMPGPFDYEKGICLITDQPKYKSLCGLDVKEWLAGRVGAQADDIRFMNDACCFLQGEALTGAAKGYRSAIGVTLGTGLGSARYADGKVVDADLWNAPFKDGIAEEYLSTRWFVRRYRELSGETVKGVKELRDLLNKEPDPSAPAWKIFIEFGKHLGEFLYGIVSAVSAPSNVVLGGNIAHAHELFLDHTRAVLAQHRFPTSLHIARLGEQSALIGAAGCFYTPSDEDFF
jgi:glucokinase